MLSKYINNNKTVALQREQHMPFVTNASGSLDA